MATEVNSTTAPANTNRGSSSSGQGANAGPAAKASPTIPPTIVDDLPGTIADNSEHDMPHADDTDDEEAQEGGEEGEDNEETDNDPKAMPPPPPSTQTGERRWTIDRFNSALNAESKQTRLEVSRSEERSDELRTSYFRPQFLLR